MILIAKLLLCFLLLMPLAAHAQLPAQLIADFAPLNGYIIMPIGDEFLVDLDASVNLREGDILTLVMPGEKVIHPVTKQVLGSIDIPTGYLQVTRIKSGYSYAKLLHSEAAPQKGDQVRRFEQTPATIVDTQGTNSQLVNQLRSELSNLDWLKTESSAEAVLIFNFANSQLQAKSSSGILLHSYAVVDGSIIVPIAAAQTFQPAGDPSEPKILQQAVSGIIDVFAPEGDEHDPSAGIIRQRGNENAGIWLGPTIKGDSVGIAVSDYDNDGIQETAFATDKKLIIASIKQGKFTQKAVLSMPAGVQILSLETIDLDGNGLKEIYLSAVSNGQLTSRAIEYVNGSYQQTIDNISWYLRVATLPNEGKVLIGQRLGDMDTDFAGRPFRISRQGSRLIEGEPLQLPTHANMYSFTTIKDAENNLLYTYLSADDYLKVVTADGTELWESGDYYGGSEARFDHTIPIGGAGAGGPFKPVYIRSRIIKSMTGEILIAQNDGLRNLERFRKFKDSRLIALTWNGHSLTESWRTSGQNGYLGDFTVGDADNDGSDEIVMAVKFKHRGLLQSARSAIVTYELN